MRFIIREQEYEKLLAAGRLKYRSGALESWRLTEAVDGYEVMRIDLDWRDAGVARSTLFHLLLDPEGGLERAKLRVLAAESDMSVDVLVEHDSLSVSRADAVGALHDIIDRPPGQGVLLPGLLGLALIVRHTGDNQDQSIVMLDPARHFQPRQASVEIEALEEENFAVMGQTLAVRPYLINQDGTRQTIWLDKYGLPVRVDDEDGLLASEDRYVRHR